MDQVQKIYDLLINKTPFSFAKFNDGEMACIKDKDAVASRGYQNSSKDLSEKLLEALVHQQDNYYVGIPCKNCYRDHYNLCMEKLNTLNTCHSSYLANLLINSNVTKTMEILKTHLKDRNIVMVVNDHANVDNLKSININPYQVYRVPNSNAWSKYDELKIKYNSCKDDDVVLFCCGPLGRVLAYEWFKNKNTLTCLELGSLFDPLTSGKCYLYHTDAGPLCSICNPTHLTQLPFDLNIILSCYHKEHYWFQEWNGYCNIFNNDYQSIHNMYQLHAWVGDQDTKFYSMWMMARCKSKMNLSNKEDKEIEDAYLKVYHEFPNRAEPLFEYCLLIQDNNIRTKYGMICASMKIPESGKWINKSIYEWHALDLLAIASYFIDKTISQTAYKKLTTERKQYIPPEQINRITSNGVFYSL